MISENSIQEVRENADLVEVVKKYVDLKKKGANWQGCCPFHEEKTPSFYVNETKGIYKCFGCGAAGADAIKFLMEKEHIDFVTTIRRLADWFNIQLEETRLESEDQEKLLKRADYLKINVRVAKIYQTKLMALPGEDPVFQELYFKRKLSRDTVIDFQIGYAPNEWRFITPLLLDNALFKPAEELGLVKTTNDRNYDIYRNRIIFPIHNERGEIVGFGGRTMDDGDDVPKYINSCESLVYKKDSILYGLYQAAKAIRDMRFAVVVEGYFDVTGFHQTGMPNTVAPCGTSLTENHAKLLKKYTNHLILMGDADKAGKKANLKAVDMLLRHGFKVDICDLPDGHDPDSFSREFEFTEDEAA